MKLLSGLLAAIFAIVLITIPASPQGFDRIERERMKEMLSTIKKEMQKSYYDPTFKGIDIEARFKKAEQRLDEVTSTGQAFAVIAQTLVDFNDSHLVFYPPATTVSAQYGFQISMVGDKAYITRIKPKSDAEKKGLQVGDQVLAVEGFRPSRSELWKLNYFYYALSPRKRVKLSVLHRGSTTPTDLDVEAKLKKRNRSVDFENNLDFNEMIRESEDAASRAGHYFATVGDTVVWRMLSFVYEPAQAAQLMDSRVKKSETLILDLRGNGGGLVDTLERLAGKFFAEDKQIAERRGRPEKKKENKPMMLKGRGADAFTGKLIVLVDQGSGSAAEIFARFVQLEKRGIVLGDVSAGAVMQSVGYSFTSGTQNVVVYGANISNADVIMSDGKSLEHVGVVPDELILPTAEDLRNRRDPVLARALELAGKKVSPEEAWKMFERANIWEED
jgi:C-terminal processing protease CtpA/Prc